MLIVLTCFHNIPQVWHNQCSPFSSSMPVYQDYPAYNNNNNRDQTELAIALAIYLPASEFDLISSQMNVIVRKNIINFLIKGSQEGPCRIQDWINRTIFTNKRVNWNNVIINHY